MLMGVAHVLGPRYGIWEKSPPPPELSSTTHDMLFSGLAEEERA